MSDLGGYLDIVLDFLFYSGVVFFFAVGRPAEALPAAFLIFSFVGTGASFLAFAALAAKHGITTSARGSKDRKSVVYGKSVSEQLDLRGRLYIKNKTTNENQTRTSLPT